MSETIKHTSLTSNSALFALAGGLYGADVVGTIAVGSYVELQQLVNGGLTSLSPPIRFLSNEIGSTRRTGLLPAGTYGWHLPDHGHNISTKLSS